MKRQHFLAATMFSMLLASCAKPGSPTIASGGSKAGKSSKLTEVKIPLPASSTFKPTSGSAVVNAFKLIVTPKDSSCVGATSINVIQDYEKSVLTQKFTRGCAYSVTLALGEKSTSDDFKAYYQNLNEQDVTDADLATSPARVTIRLVRTPDGAAAFMPESNTSVTPVPEPTPNPTPNPTPIPTPTPGLTALPDRIKSAVLTGANGKSTTLDAIFTSKYLVVDYSQLGCGYCVQHAAQTNRDKDYQTLVSGDLCRSITVVSTSTVDDWIQQFDRDLSNIKTFAGKNSYGYAGGFQRFGQLMGVSITGTPTVQLIDRSGKVIVPNLRSNPDALESYCK